MRRGEILALEWNDLDFNENTVGITKSTTTANGEIITKCPKTQSSIRTISVPNHIMVFAKNYRKEQLKYRLSIGDKWIGKNHIFTQWNGEQINPSTPYHKFQEIIKHHNESSDDNNKLPLIPLHGLRHTNATLLISQSLDVRTISGRLGHAQTSTTTDIYTHFLQSTDRTAAKALENLLLSTSK